MTELVPVEPAGMTTADKLASLIEQLETINPDESPPEVASFVAGIQMLKGLGFDLLGILRPDDDDDAAMMVDRLICLLLQLRGDDLPPFDATLYGELDG